jgi:hypothetical protein
MPHCVVADIHFRNVCIRYVFISDDFRFYIRFWGFDSIFDYDKIDENQNEKHVSVRFRFIFNPS